jgi:hypothetical protein
MFRQLIRRQNIYTNNVRKRFFSNDNKQNLTFLDKLNLETYLKNIQVDINSIKFWTMLNGCVSILTLILNYKK